MAHDPAARPSELTLEEKVRLLTGRTGWTLHGSPAVGLLPVTMSDGPVGVRGDEHLQHEHSANTPNPTAIAATWDEELTARVAGLFAAEARRQGVDVVLAPVLNLHRSPLGGRHFECFSEDPLLTGRIGAAFVRALQAAGVAACPKHFIGNETETGPARTPLAAPGPRCSRAGSAPRSSAPCRPQGWPPAPRTSSATRPRPSGPPTPPASASAPCARSTCRRSRTPSPPAPGPSWPPT